MITVQAFIHREKDGSYSISVDENAPINYGLVGEGATVEEAIEDWNGTYMAMKEAYSARRREFVEAEFKFAFDTSSFLAYYGDIITFKGLSKVTGISAAQLSQYATGYRHPKPSTTEKIRQGLKAFASELNQITLL